MQLLTSPHPPSGVNIHNTSLIEGGERERRVEGKESVCVVSCGGLPTHSDMLACHSTPFLSHTSSVALLLPTDPSLNNTHTHTHTHTQAYPPHPAT